MTDPWIQSKRNDTEQQSGSSGSNGGAASGPIAIEQRHNGDESILLEFEDNFTSPKVSIDSSSSNSGSSISNISDTHQPLSDSATYLAGLERKLRKIKKSTNLLEALTQKRNDCLRTLLQENHEVNNLAQSSVHNNNATLELEEPINNTESTVLELYRHIQPVQALTVGETVHIIQHDQLEQQRKDREDNDAAKAEPSNETRNKEEAITELSTEAAGFGKSH